MPQRNDSQLTSWAADHGLRLYLWQIAETEDELAALLPTDYNYIAEAHRRFTSSKRRLEWLAARVLLHHVAGVRERLTYLSNGAPTLEAPAPHSRSTGVPPVTKLHLSISHSTTTVALLLSPTPCGIDIEQRAPRALRLRSHFLDATEEAVFFPTQETPPSAAQETPPSATQGTQASRLCQPTLSPLNLSPEDTAALLWSAKEAVFKCFSSRGIDYVTQIHLHPDATSLIASFDAATPCATAEVRVAFSLLPDFVLTVCIE